MPNQHIEKTPDPNQVLSDFLKSVSRYAVNARRVEQLDYLSGRYRKKLDDLIDGQGEKLHRWEDTWSEPLIRNLASLAIKGRQAEVEANKRRQPPFLYARGLKILDRLPNWAGMTIEAASISGDPIIEQSHFPSSGAYFYYDETRLTEAAGQLHGDNILEPDDTTLVLLAPNGRYGHRHDRFHVPLLNEATLQPQVTLRVADYR
ncbi:MAG: hypothetical protein ABI602_03010 [Candidatus Saccharibacteria bacterium]